ncbi:MAG: hypothetical protein LUI87_17285 [Lachnospiraceae bacterium]|nr:hypothetical protein [Lachnospiraceae bacterium]
MITETRAAGKKKWMHAALYMLFFITVCFLAYQLPYCHDDWHWGLPDRVELLKKLFKNYNGRYLGNITILLITRSAFAKTLIPAFWMVWLLWEMETGIFQISGQKKTAGRTGQGGGWLFMLLLTIFLLVALPQTLFVQSYGWFAAFANFVPPVVLFLVWFNQTEDIYSSKADSLDESLHCALGRGVHAGGKLCRYILLGLCTQLFSENVTVFALMYACWLIAYAKIRRNRFYSAHFAYLGGAAAGAVLMFINGGYRGGVGFKSISLSVAAMYYQLRDQIMDHLFLNNALLNVSLAIVIVCLLMRAEASTSLHLRKAGKKGKKHSLLDACTALIVCGFAFYSVWHSIRPNWRFSSDEGTNNLVELLLCALFFMFVLLGIWRTVDSSERISICILYLCAAVSAVPLMAASPIGARCFYFNYVLQCLTVLRLAEYLLRDRKCSIWYPTLLTAAAVAVMGAAYSYVFTCNGATERYRIQLIEEAIENEAEEVVLPYMPYPSCCYVTEPMNESWMKYYKDFYGIPQDMTVTFQ